MMRQTVEEVGSIELPGRAAEMSWHGCPAVVVVVVVVVVSVAPPPAVNTATTTRRANVRRLPISSARKNAHSRASTVDRSSLVCMFSKVSLDDSV